MSTDGEKPVIIVVKKVAGGHGHHGGSWKVAIADLMTAMMALFMVLWLVGQSPKTRASVGAYFRDPLGLAGGGNTDVTSGPMSGGSGFFDGGNTAMSHDLMISPGQPVLKASGQGEKRQILDNKRARQRLAQALMKLRQQDWARHAELTAVEEGLRIEVQDTEDESLFPAGTTSINQRFADILDKIAIELGALPNHLVIEGHTDARPHSRAGLTNWEVSTRRANAARRYLVSKGVRQEQVVEVRGYADQRLRLWHDPTNPRNRRISVLVLLERGRRSKPPSDPPPDRHGLDEDLEDLDFRPFAPKNKVELDPEGEALPTTPSKGGPR